VRNRRRRRTYLCLTVSAASPDGNSRNSAELLRDSSSDGRSGKIDHRKNEESLEMSPPARASMRCQHMTNVTFGIFVRTMACIAAALALSTAAAAQAAPILPGIHVHVTGLRSSNGHVICTLFNSPNGYPSNDSKSLAKRVVPVKDRMAEIDFDGVAPGKYAFVMFHDENANGKFDFNVLGMPKEGYAFSDNVRPLFAALSFKAAAFDYPGGNLSMTILMRY